MYIQYEKIFFMIIFFMISWSQIIITEAMHKIDTQLNDQSIVETHVPNKFVTTPLHELVLKYFDNKQEKLAQIKVLLDAGADVNAQNEDLRTPLWLVTFYGGDIDLIKLLIQYKADITIPDVFNETPLHNLVDRNNIQAVSMLLNIAAAMQSNTLKKIMNFKNDAQETPVEIVKTPEMDQALLVSEALHESLQS